ncbi:putative ribonuclease H protein [Vitis vinifera]|uniref:Putative ribonuclease H protein n=1 Tax=Vitis vinifera TaxID=29760 RepID=A0A438D4Z1_VITVI|nr:putative ribonuclease H protein [Vitis vinifera]
MGRGSGKEYGIVELQLFGKVLPLFGMPTEGCEREILKLLHKMRDRRDRSENLSGKKRKGQRTSRFDRELKKLEWSVNYSGSGGDRSIKSVLHEDSIVSWNGCGGGGVVFWDNRGAAAGGNGGGQLFNFLPGCGTIRGVCAGDFNMIRFPTERSRGGRLSPSMRRFTEVIEELELRDLPLQGGCSRGVEVFWLDQYQIILQLFLMEGDDERAHTFQIREHVAEGGRLQRGAEEMIKVKKQEAWNSLDFWDKEERVRELSLEEEEARKEAREMYKKWVLLEETSWRQKSREIWLKEGIETLGRSKRRCAGRTRAAGRPGGWKPRIDALTFERLEEGDVEGLEKPFTEEEVLGLCQAVVPRSFSTAQNAFVEDGRLWMQCWSLMRQLTPLKSNRGAILCKLDIEKAYDHVDWDFLLAVMEKMGFGERWCRWIKWCLSTVSGWGVFGALFDSGKKRRRGPDITLVAISGLRVNLEKSELIPVGRVENVDELADEFGYRVGKLPFHLFRNAVRALLGKWVWRFANERKALWNQVIRGKYGEERGGWRSCEPREAYGLGLWKAISKMGHKVTPFVGFVVGDGEKVKFWKDKWCETIPLSEVFPSLFALASNKEAWINEVWTAGGEGGGVWNPCFNRPFNDWEMEDVEWLLCCLEGKKVRGDEEDKVKWMASKDGDFSVKSLYRTMQPGSHAFFPSKIIWNSCVQPKLSFFAWEASWGRVLTLDRLQKRGWVMANRCFLCHKSEETIDHLLIHCEKTREVWMVFLSFFGVSWVFPRSVKENPCRMEGVLCGKEKEGGCGNWDRYACFGLLEG